MRLQSTMATQARSAVERTKESSSSNERKPLSLDDVVLYAPKITSFKGTWISDKEVFHQDADCALKFDVTTQKNTLIAKDPILSDSELFLSADQNYLLVKGTEKKIHSYLPVSKYSIYDINNKSIKELADGRPLPEAVWAPKGSALVFVLDNDVYYRKLDGSSGETRRLTSNGKIEEIFNGITDWMYGEEVFQGRSSVLWFSPNGDHLVFPTFDDSEVDDVILSRYNIPASTTEQYPEVAKYKYAKVGRPIPKVTLNLVDLTKKEPTLVHLKARNALGSEPILWPISWLDDKTIAATWTNRVQNRSQIVTYSLDGQSNWLLSQDSPGGWLLWDLVGYPPKPSNGYLVLVQLQPIGDDSVGLFKHVVRYRMSNGKLEDKTDLTPGATWVSRIVDIDDANGIVYYIATPAGRPSQKQLFQVSLRGSAATPKCLTRELMTPEGKRRLVAEIIHEQKRQTYTRWHIGKRVRVRELGVVLQGAVLLRAHVPRPGSRLYRDPLRQVAGATLRVVRERRAAPDARPPSAGQAHGPRVPVPGARAKVRLLLPADFDPADKYPMIVKVYAGPNSQMATDAFGLSFEQLLASRRRVICAFIDGRGTSAKGSRMLYALYRNLGGVEMEDQTSVTRQLQRTYPWIDAERTGIWGRSYGGYAAATILARDRGSVFKCGISACPVTSWYYYDAIYTERYMGLPSADDNLRAYGASQVTNLAEGLRGKRFLLVHGTGDDNVHPQNSMALSKSLVRAGLPLEQFLYPDEYHPLKGVYGHMFATFDEFFSRHLGYEAADRGGCCAPVSK